MSNQDQDQDQEKQDHVNFIKSMFPSVEIRVIEAVYESNSNSLELTLNDMITLSDSANIKYSTSSDADSDSGADSGAGNTASMTVQEQLASDEALALKLQQREARRHHSREITRDIAEKLGINLNDDSDDSPPRDEFKVIAELAKKGVDNLRQSVVEAVRNISKRISSSARQSDTTPRTVYTSLPTDDFDTFLNDEQPPVGSPSNVYQSPTSASPGAKTSFQ